MSLIEQTYPVLKYFKYEHLPEPLKEVSKRISELAFSLADEFPEGKPEVAAGLRKLLEAKDCFVRARL